MANDGLRISCLDVPLFDGDRSFYREWVIRLTAALDELEHATEKQKLKFVMHHTKGRTFQRIRDRLPWIVRDFNHCPKIRSAMEVLQYLDSWFGEYDHKDAVEKQCYDPSILKQKVNEFSDGRAAHWILG